MNITELGCCGVLEFRSISEHRTPEAVLDYFVTRIAYLEQQARDGGYTIQAHHKARKPFIIFTGVISTVGGEKRTYYGQNLAAYITSHDLGTLQESLEKQNWTSNIIKVWLWCPDYEALAAWAAERIKQVAPPIPIANNPYYDAPCYR